MFFAPFIFALAFWLVHSWDLLTLTTFTPDSEVGSDNAKDLMEVRREYLEEEKLKWKYPTITNLDDYLSRLSEDANCFIVADNFQTINLEPGKIPVILRNPMPFVHTLASKEKTAWKLVLGTSTLPYRNISVPSYISELPCALSKFLIGFRKGENAPQHLCLIINHVEYFLQAKPPCCYAHLGIYPPVYANTHWDRLVYPEIFNFDVVRFQAHFYPPCTVTTFNIMVQLKHKKHRLTSSPHRLLRKWKWTTKFAYLTNIQQNAFIHLEVSRISGLMLWLHPNGYINSMSVYRICYSCRFKNYKLYGTVVRKLLNKFTRSEINHNGFPSADENMVWKIHDYGFTNSLLSKVLKYSQSCITKPEYKNLWLAISSKLTAIESLAVAHSYVWKSIMNNFSLTDIDKTEKCKVDSVVEFQIQVLPASYDKSLFAFPYSPPDDLAGLRFIGCGQQGLSLLPFNEFVAVFDKFIWVAIATTMIIVSISIKLLWSQTVLTDNTFSFLKLIFEQGNPFSDAVASKARFRGLLLPLLFMSIIVSNGYKNTNVYKMVTQRRPLLYESFDELVRDKFRVYTRSLAIFTENPRHDHLNYYKNLLTILGGNYSLEVVTEMDLVNIEFQSLVWHRGGMPIANSSLQKYGVISATQLHPFVVPKLEKILSNEVRLIKANVSNEYEMEARVFQVVDRMYPKMQSTEKALLLRAILECQSTAVILPDYMCREVKQFLAQKRKLQNVFVGRESYTDIGWTMAIIGSLPPHLIRRIQGVGQSGIWQWWTHLIGNVSNNQDLESNSVKAATMTGNIVIVFILWSCCIAVSIIAILVEVCNFHVRSCLQKLTRSSDKNIPKAQVHHINVKQQIPNPNMDLNGCCNSNLAD